MQIKPLRDLVLVQEITKEENKSAGGVILPDNARKPVGPIKGTVIALGPKLSGNGEVKVGDVVLFDKFAATEVEGYYAVKFELLLGVYDPQ